jgi:hypothetical protein
MTRRVLVGAIWFWGFWAFGSTVEFLKVGPSWPALIVGAACAIAAWRHLGVKVPNGDSRLSSANSAQTETA